MNKIRIKIFLQTDSCPRSSESVQKVVMFLRLYFQVLVRRKPCDRTPGQNKNLLSRKALRAQAEALGRPLRQLIAAVPRRDTRGPDRRSTGKADHALAARVRCVGVGKKVNRKIRHTNEKEAVAKNQNCRES